MRSTGARGAEEEIFVAGNQQGGRRRWNNGKSDEQKKAETTALEVYHPPRMPMPVEAKGLVTGEGQWKALTEAVWPSATSVDGVMLALEYCRARNLDPMKRPVHIVPMYNAKLRKNVETVWPGISEIRTTATRTGTWAGNDECAFGRIMTKAFSATKSGESNDGPWSKTVSCPEIKFPEWAQMTVYRIVSGARVPFVGPKVYYEEIFSGQQGLRVPNERWQNNPRQMLEKCAEAAALRRAFPEELGNEYTAEEMEGQILRDGGTVQAKYHVVEGEETSGEATDEQQAAAGEAAGADEGEDALNGWDREDLQRFMAYLRGGIPRAPDLETLESAMAKNKEFVDTLPKEERAEIDELEKAAREKFAAAQQTRAAGDEQPQDADFTEVDDAQQGEQQTDDFGGDAEEQEREEPPYLVNFRTRLAAVELLADLTKLETVEKRVIENQPAWVAKICEDLIADKRAAITAPRN
jgi:phage recombination protein Bet